MKLAKFSLLICSAAFAFAPMVPFLGFPNLAEMDAIFFPLSTLVAGGPIGTLVGFLLGSKRLKDTHSIGERIVPFIIGMLVAFFISVGITVIGGFLIGYIA